MAGSSIEKDTWSYMYFLSTPKVSDGVSNLSLNVFLFLERPFSCEQCGKKFKTRHCVNIHLRSHGIGGYSWCCEECGKTFNQISAYHVHLKVHSNIREFACEDCGMTFKLKHSLKKHQLVHKAEFGHTCDYCGKKFKASGKQIHHPQCLVIHCYKIPFTALGQPDKPQTTSHRGTPLQV